MKNVLFFSRFTLQKNIRLFGIIVILLAIPTTLFTISYSQDNRQHASENVVTEEPHCSCESLNATEIATDSTTTFSYRTKVTSGLSGVDVIAVRFHELRERNNTIEELSVSPEIISTKSPSDQTGSLFESQWTYTTPKRSVVKHGDIYTIRADATCTRKQSNRENASPKIAIANMQTAKKVLAANSALQVGTFIPGIKATVTQLNMCHMMQFVFN